MRVELRQPIPVHDLSPDDSLDLTNALDALAGAEPAKAKLVELGLFSSLSVEDAAVLGVSRATADRHWLMAYARARLTAALSGD